MSIERVAYLAGHGFITREELAKIEKALPVAKRDLGVVLRSELKPGDQYTVPEPPPGDDMEATASQRTIRQVVGLAPNSSITVLDNGARVRPRFLHVIVNGPNRGQLKHWVGPDYEVQRVERS